MIALALAVLQALAPMPPRALHDAGGQRIPFRAAESSGRIDWNALDRKVVLHGYRGHPERTWARVLEIDFRPTAAAGLEQGRLAVAGRDGERVRLELWRVADVLGQDGGHGHEIVERAVVWEAVEADSIGLLVWNPMPPRGAALSLRALWHQRRELSRFDVDGAGWATPTLEATPRGPAPSDVLQVAELEGPLARWVLGEHPERGLLLVLGTPCRCVMCCGCDPAKTVRLVLADGDRDGRLDRAVRLDLDVWDAEGWSQLGDYTRVFE